MTTSISASDWFNPFPLQYYAQIGEESAVNIPDDTAELSCSVYGGVPIKVGPIVRLLATHEKNSANYRATVMIIAEGLNYEEVPKLTYTVGPSFNETQQESVNVINGEFPGEKFFEEQNHTFFKYYVNLKLTKFEQKLIYGINGDIQPHFHFYIPSVEQSMNVVSFSCNGFSLATKTDNYRNSLWYDILANHSKIHYHVAIGGGDQLYCDKVKLASEELQKWTEGSSSQKAKAKFSPELAESLEKFYMKNYSDWFGFGHWKGTNGKTLQSLFPKALSTIPTINIYDDHDIIDGYGTYKDATMSGAIFTGLGKIAFKYYMLFQHHTAPHDERQYKEPSWIFGAQKGPYMGEYSHSNYVRLGKEISFVGFDCRTERKSDQILTNATYKKIFDRLSAEISANGDVKHLLVLLGVPIAYPRLVWLEKVLTSPVLTPIKSLAQKGIIAKGLVNEFDGSVEVLDDLEDHWCAKHHKRERNQLVGQLQQWGAEHGVRITILSGDVHLAAIGRFKSRIHKHAVRTKKIAANENILIEPEKDPRLMLNLISSAVTNAPPPNAMATLLYKRSKIHKFDHSTDEDMVRIFDIDVDNTSRENNMFNNKRNWSDLVLVKQLPKYHSLDSGVGKLPGLINENEKALYVDVRKNTLDNVAYPVFPESLSCSLRIEKTSTVVNSETAQYEVIVPPLVGSTVLENVGVKD